MISTTINSLYSTSYLNHTFIPVHCSPNWIEVIKENLVKCIKCDVEKTTDEFRDMYGNLLKTCVRCRITNIKNTIKKRISSCRCGNNNGFYCRNCMSIQRLTVRLVSYVRRRDIRYSLYTPETLKITGIKKLIKETTQCHLCPTKFKYDASDIDNIKIIKLNYKKGFTADNSRLICSICY